MVTMATKADLRADVRALTNIRSVARLTNAEIDAELEEVHAESWDLASWPQKVQIRDGSFAGDGRVWLSDQTIAVQRLVRNGEVVPPLDHAVAVEPDMIGYLFTREFGSAFVQLFPAPVQRMTPEGFLVYDDKVVVTSEITAPAFTLDGLSPWMDSEYHRLYAYVAAARILSARAGDPGKVSEFQQRADRTLARMRKRYVESHDSSTVRLGARW